MRPLLGLLLAALASSASAGALRVPELPTPASPAPSLRLLPAAPALGAAALTPSAVVTRLHAGAYEVSAGQGAQAVFRLEQGVLTAKTQPREDGAQPIDTAKEFANAVRLFDGGVAAVEGEFAEDEASALSTQTGRMAAANGFTRALVLPEQRRVLLVRPQDAALGSDGKVWRRARTRAVTQGGTKQPEIWQRYESETGDSAWILRRRLDHEIVIYEFPGRERPKPGTAAATVLVFTNKGGKLEKYVSVKGVVLDADEEERAAAAALGL